MSHKIKVTLEVATEAQARELEATWREIVTGEPLARTEALEHSRDWITERARVALGLIESAIRQHPTTGQTQRLVRFLAGVYNGADYPFDLTDLRALDTKLANACLDYLNYDRLCKREVHHHLSGGDRELHQWIERYRVEPRIQLNSSDEQAARLRALVKRTERHPSEFAREAFNAVLERYEGREFDSLVSFAGPALRAGDEPLVRHACRLSKAETPLCGAPGGPWRAAAFHFETLTCEACKDLVLGDEPQE